MNKKKSMIVSINNKSNLYDGNNTHSKGNNSTNVYNQMQTKNNRKNKQTSFYHAKPLLIATISAICIGALLGFLMLIMFTELGNKTTEPLSVITNHEDNNENQQINTEKNENKGTLINGLQAFVLQSGVFSELENAQKWTKTYEEAGFPIVIWNRDEQLFLFAGITTTREQGKLNAEQLSQANIEIFVKEWFTDSKEVLLNETEQEWLNSFQYLWEETLQSTSEEGKFLTEEWKVLLKRGNGEKIFINLVNVLNNYLDQNDIDNEPFKQQHFLLLAWHKFEQILND